MERANREPGTGNREPGGAAAVRWRDARGVRWVVEAERLPHLRGIAEALGDPALRPAREIPSRAHFRLPPDGPGMRGAFVKHYRLLGWTRRLRHVVRPLPAAVEWAVARALAPHGLAAVVPWAWGVRRRAGIPVECFLAADDLGDLTTLEEWLPAHRCVPRPAFRGALAGLAGTLRRLHGLGFFHGDPHQRNIVPRDGPDGLHWAFLDFQQARRARFTAPYRRLRDLGRVFHGVRLDLGRTERARLLRAYLGPRARLPRRLFRLLEAITLYYEFRLLRRRARRCLTQTEHVRRARLGPFTVWHAAGADMEVLGACLGDPARAEDLGLEVRAVPGRGRRAWLGAHALLARGLPTPRPLAWALEEGGRGEYYVTEGSPEARPLAAALEAAGAAGGPEALMRAAGAALRGLHDLGGWAGAAAGEMLAVPGGAEGDGGGRVLFSHPEAFRFRPWVGDRRRRRDVARLARALAGAAPLLPEGAWRAFLRAYLPPAAPAERREAFRRIIDRQSMRSVR